MGLAAQKKGEDGQYAIRPKRGPSDHFEKSTLLPLSTILHAQMTRGNKVEVEALTWRGKRAQQGRAKKLSLTKKKYVQNRNYAAASFLLIGIELFKKLFLFGNLHSNPLGERPCAAQPSPPFFWGTHFMHVCRRE